MGFFNFGKNKNTTSANKYAAHPDVLEKIAISVSSTALQQIQENASKTKKLACYCEVGSWAVELSSKPFQQYYGAALNEYCHQFSDFGMEDVPEYDARAFLKALLPFLETHIKGRFRIYFPEATYVTVVQTTYHREHRRDTDYDVIDAIEIHVSDNSYYKTPDTPKLNKW
jgi:hypothetical protein